jgi:hypothetical protein
MSKSLRLGLFYFRNDDVVLLSASPKELSLLADRIEQSIDKGQFVIPIHESAQVSAKNPAKLYASSTSSGDKEENAFWWKCSEATVEKLRVAASKSSEQYFDVSGSTPFLLVTCSSHYNDQWWQTYG